MSETTQAEIPAHQQRVLDERTALDEKIAKLEAFTKTQTFDAIQFIERNALHNQLDVMRKYSAILKDRISRF